MCLPTPVLLPGEFHGQRSLVGYSPWGHKESDMTERLTHTHVVLLYMAFIMLKYVIFIPNLLRVFIKNGCVC